MRRLSFVGCAMFVAPLLAGCVEQLIYDSIANPPVKAGGTMAVTLESGKSFEVPAMAGERKDPFHILANTPAAIVFISAGQDVIGASVRETLAEKNSSVEVLLDHGDSSIDVHFGGKSCGAEEGSITLRTTDTRHLEGEFHAQGYYAGDESPCSISGTLVDIPISAEE